MYSFPDSVDVVIAYLQSYSPVVFMNMMNKLLHDVHWTDGVGGIHFFPNDDDTAIDEVFIGMYNKDADALDLQMLSRAAFIEVINTVTKKMIRKNPDYKCQLRELCKLLVERMARGR